MSEPSSTPAGRPRVAVVFGGRSGEHGISCVTASGVLAALDRDVWDVVAVGITRTGRWVVVEDDPARWALPAGAAGIEQLPQVTEDAGVGVALPSGTGSRALVPLDAPAGIPARTGSPGPVDPVGPAGPIGPIDVVLPLLHGPFGEDGTIQGMLELGDVRYVGSGVLASAVGMDKHTTKTVLVAAGLDVAPWVLVTDRAWRADPDGVAARVAALGWPVFVKPSRAGSSLGVSRVEGPDGLAAAVEAARAVDPRVVVEAAVAGREVECGVLGELDPAPGAPAASASVPGEVVVAPGRGFYDFETKYLDTGAATLVCPADLPSEVAERVRGVALEVFEAVGCEGLARVDVFVTEGGRVVVNEVNTMPGFTPHSMYPRMWAASGVPYPALVDRLLRLALARPVGPR